jgi:hypothetical protein
MRCKAFLEQILKEEHTDPLIFLGERIAGLGRHLANLNKNCADTYSAQWFERTLDDRFVHSKMNSSIGKR